MQPRNKSSDDEFTAPPLKTGTTFEAAKIDSSESEPVPITTNKQSTHDDEMTSSDDASVPKSTDIITAKTKEILAEYGASDSSDVPIEPYRPMGYHLRLRKRPNA